MVLMLLGAVLLSAPQDSLVINLEEAVSRAVRVSPEVAAAEGVINVPRGARGEDFWPFPSNPSISYGRVRRTSAGQSVYDWGLAISQDIEIAGQWLFRRGAADRLVKSAEERAVDAERRASLLARLVYLNLAIAERRGSLTDSSAVFGERLADLAGRQLGAGEINRLEHNAAVLEAARSRSAAERAGAELGAAAAEFARVLGLGGDTVPRTLELPGVPNLAVPPGRVILGLARDRRADLSAARYALEAAEKSLTAARLSVVPNLTVAALTGFEDGTDDLFGFAVGITVPLFHRGQAVSGFAMANREVATAELVATERRIQAEVDAWVERFTRARAAERRFATDVLRAATENVTLTETALAEGEASVTEVVVLRTTAVAAQLEYLVVLSDATAAWFQLAAALNVSPAELAGLLENDLEEGP